MEADWEADREFGDGECGLDLESLEVKTERRVGARMVVVQVQGGIPSSSSRLRNSHTQDSWQLKSFKLETQGNSLGFVWSLVCRNFTSC